MLPYSILHSKIVMLPGLDEEEESILEEEELCVARHLKLSAFV